MPNAFVNTSLMDGFADAPHITAEQTGLANQGLYGPDDYVLDVGKNSEAQILTNNSIRIFDAVYVIQGRRDVIPANGYTDVTIDNGSQGMYRHDIIVRRYQKDASSEVETTSYAVIKGTPTSSSSAATDPDVPTGDIRSGATLHNMKLYRVNLEGLNIVSVEPLFNVLCTLDELNSNLSKHIHTVITATTLTGTAVGSTKTISMPDLANWQEIRIMTEIGDESRVVHTIDRSIGTPFSFIDSAYASTSYNGKMTVTVDWDNNAIKITPNRVAGWTVANLRITRVWGTIRI